MDWAHVEARVGVKCGRPLRVFASGSAANSCDTTVTTGDALNASDQRPQRPLSLFLELPYALRVALGARVDVWLQKRDCVSTVQNVNWYFSSKALENEELRGTGNNGDVSLQSALLAPSTAAAVGTNQVDVQQDTVIQLLVGVVQRLVAWFASLQMQYIMQNLKALNNPRATFELELLQHQLHLETLVTSNQEGSQYFVDFVLPLFGDEPSWNEEAATESLSIDSYYTPNSFKHPNFKRGAMHQIVLQMRLELDLWEHAPATDIDWKYQIYWPSGMTLSSHVTQIPPSNRKCSSIELVTTCKENILDQWSKRRDFVFQLRSKVVVLEYDTVDFSNVVFMLQEQRDLQSPLRIILLQLLFTVEYFLTNCFSDLQVILLDGDASVVIRLDPYSPTADSVDSAPENIVAAFLESTSKNILTYFYG